MNNVAFANLVEQAQPLLAPVLKANKLAVANLEKVVNVQMEALNAYVNLGLGQLKAAIEVSNTEELHAFFNSQAEVAGAVRQRMLNDAKTLADLGASYKDGINKLAEENLEVLNKKTAEAVETAVKKVQKAA